MAVQVYYKIENTNISISNKKRQGTIEESGEAMDVVWKLIEAANRNKAFAIYCESFCSKRAFDVLMLPSMAYDDMEALKKRMREVKRDDAGLVTLFVQTGIRWCKHNNLQKIMMQFETLLA